MEFDGVRNSSLSVFEIVERNLRIFNEVLLNIGHLSDRPDIIVFPESVLHSGRGGDSFEYHAISSEVPRADGLIAPCDYRDGRYTETLVWLSCAARRFDVYLVVNLAEKTVCNGTPKCKFEKWNLYNTNVVFNRDGTIIARYRKYNLYAEGYLNAPLEPETATFKTDFGVTFGMFICFDIIFKRPTLDLVDQGIKHFVYPAVWFSDYPFLTAIQIHEAWAYEHNVTLLASGEHNPPLGSGGSGIYHGRRGALVADISAEGGTKFYTAKILKDGISQNTDAPKRNANSALLDNFFLKGEDISQYSYELLQQPDTVQTVCKNHFCCNFDISSTFDPEVEGMHYYKYRLLALSGIRSISDQYFAGTDICAIVSCTDDTAKSCESRFPKYADVSWPRTFKRITIKANYTISPAKAQYPTTLLSDLRPVSAHGMEWSSKTYNNENLIERQLTLIEPESQLYVFGIYGRDVSRDHEP